MIAQLDMRIEADNLHCFRRNFRHMPSVVFPKPFDDFVCSQVLVESFEEGQHISEVTSAVCAL